MRLKTIILSLLLPVLMASCTLFDGLTTNSSELVVGDVVTISGDVVDSIDDCTFDGICALVLDTDEGLIAAIWATGMVRCEGQFMGDAPLGQSLEVYGLVVENLRGMASVSICTDSTYYIRQT